MSDRADLNKHDMSLYLPAVRGIIRRYNDPEQRAEAGQSAAILLQAMMGFGVFDAPVPAPAKAPGVLYDDAELKRRNRAFEEELRAAESRRRAAENEAELKRRAETELKAVRAHPTSMNEVGPYGNGASEKLGNSGTAR